MSSVTPSTESGPDRVAIHEALRAWPARHHYVLPEDPVRPSAPEPSPQRG